MTAVYSRITAGEIRRASISGPAPSERLYAACFNMNGKFMFFGGRTGIRAFDNQLYNFDVKEPTWKRVTLVREKKNLPLPSVTGHTITRISKNEAIIVGGRKSIFSVSNEVYLLNLESNTLTLVETKGDRLPKLHSHTAWEHKGKLYVFGGFNESKKALQTMFVLNLKTKTWKKIENVPDFVPKLYGHTATMTDNGVVYIFGGQTVSGSFNIHIITYDVEKDMWKKLSRRSVARSWHTASRIGNFIYLIGGMNSKDIVPSIDVFDTNSNTFLNYRIGGQYQARHGHCAAVADGKVFIFGGSVATSWYKGLSNSVMVLDTAPVPRVAKVDDKLSLIEKTKRLLLDVNVKVLSGSNVTTEYSIETEVEEQIKNLPKVSNMKGIEDKVKAWKRIGELYYQVLHSRSKMDSLTEEMKGKVVEVRSTIREYEGLQEIVEFNKTVANKILSELEAADDSLKAIKIKRTTIEQSNSDASFKLKGLYKALSSKKEVVNGLKDNLVRLNADLEKKRSTQHILSESLSSSKQERLNDEKEEKRLIRILEELRTKRSDLEKDHEDWSNEYLKLIHRQKEIQLKLSEIEALKTKMASLREVAEGLNLQYHDLIQSQTKLYEKMKEYDEENHEVEDTTVDKEREMSWIPPTLARVHKKMEAELRTIELRLAELSDLISTNNGQKQDIDTKIKMLQKQLQEIQARFASFEDDKTNTKLMAIVRRIDEITFEIEGEVTKLGVAEDDVRRVMGDIDRLKGRISSFSDEIKHIQSLEQSHSKDYTNALARLRAVYLDLELNFNAALALSRRVINGRADIRFASTSFKEHLLRLTNAESLLRTRLAELEKELLECQQALAAVTKAKEALLEKQDL